MWIKAMGCPCNDLIPICHNISYSTRVLRLLEPTTAKEWLLDKAAKIVFKNECFAVVAR